MIPAVRVVLAVFAAALCVLAVGARAQNDELVIGGDWALRNCGTKFCICVEDVCSPASLTAGQLETREPIAMPCDGCILVDGKWVLSVPPGFHRSRCLPVGSDQIVDCWVAGEPTK